MLREKIQQIIQEPKKAALNVALLSIIPFLHLLGLLLMLVVTLRKGWREGLLLTVIVSGCTVLLSVFVLHRGATEMILQVLNPFLLWSLALVLYNGASWQKVIQLITAVGLALVLCVYYFYPHSAAAWSADWSRILTLNLQQIKQMHPGLINQLSAQDWQHIITLFGAFAPGLRALLYVGSGLLSLVLARYLQAVLYNPGGLKQELYYWHLGCGTGGVITLMLLGVYFKQSPVLLSMVPVLMLPLLCDGLSLVHFLTAGYRYQFIVLLVFYVCILFVLQQLLLFVLLLGYLDCFINFRKYSAQKKVNL
jgi:hypothetical protein